MEKTRIERYKEFLQETFRKSEQTSWNRDELVAEVERAFWEFLYKDLTKPSPAD